MINNLRARVVVDVSLRTARTPAMQVLVLWSDHQTATGFHPHICTLARTGDCGQSHHVRTTTVVCKIVRGRVQIAFLLRQNRTRTRTILHFAISPYNLGGTAVMTRVCNTLTVAVYECQSGMYHMVQWCILWAYDVVILGDGGPFRYPYALESVDDTLPSSVSGVCCPTIPTGTTEGI